MNTSLQQNLPNFQLEKTSDTITSKSGLSIFHEAAMALGVGDSIKTGRDTGRSFVSWLFANGVRKCSWKAQKRCNRFTPLDNQRTIAISAYFGGKPYEKIGRLITFLIRHAMGLAVCLPTDAVVVGYGTRYKLETYFLVSRAVTRLS